MDTIKINGALADQRNEESLAPKLVREPAADGIRLLKEWELALAGGGGTFDPGWD